MVNLNLVEYSEALFAECASVLSGASSPAIDRGTSRRFDDVEVMVRERPGADVAVSVLIPTFNRPLLLRRAIESVVELGSRDLEIVVVNDGGTAVGPDTVRYMRSLPIPATLCCHRRNLGLAAARNTAAHFARGAWLMTLDDDDELLPGGVDALLAAGEAAGYGFVHGDHVRRYFARDTPPYEEHVRRGGDVFQLLYFENCIVNGTFLISKPLFTSIGGYREDLAVQEDYHLHIRAASRTSFRYVEAPTFVYNCRDSIERMNLNRRLFWFATSMVNHLLFSALFPTSAGVAAEQKAGEYEHVERALQEGASRETVLNLIGAWWRTLERSGLRGAIQAELPVASSVCPSLRDDLARMTSTLGP